ncbi:MAG: Smr/MutS family protein [Deltaproteobacteria bacterium]|nr:Smr/MutS family protein [Deltaproteobacteria bacterium]
MKKKEDIFNPAFQDLKVKVKRSVESKKDEDVMAPAIREPIDDDKTIFSKAMSDVTPIPGADRERAPGQGKILKPAHPAHEGDQEVIEHLRDLVKGSIDMDITFSDEYIEGAIRGVSRKVMKMLKRGRLPVQAHIDLHGLTKKEAEAEVRNFLLSSHRRGLRCVLIVHGRGLNSPDSFPVLKERLPIWLNRGPARKIVLAFASAMPYDGGTGAIYVLLRKG